ncbi:low molecular weight phosphatase family protein [Corynebacterium hansenii]|uniref:Low molecular weight phosphatase family protein n=1 Tax=Corynebacterium hansenii TaxID=394964 RepID=A0ABV7ZRD5_9CORY|nr:low molecular weight phosphatase family protein [Corynebacterium hansenii]WJZ00938.1 Arsenate-mycothiol transferase ArsC1 [Corynebacterium hansenii]
MPDKPTVYFLCNTNSGKSQMAEAIMRLRADEAGRDIDVISAGVTPGDAINEGSAASLSKIGADMTCGNPKAIDADAMRAADRVIVVGGAEIPVHDGMKTTVERWEVDEPSRRGIEGEERMDLIRDEIDGRVRKLLDEL